MRGSHKWKWKLPTSLLTLIVLPQILALLVMAADKPYNLFDIIGLAVGSGAVLLTLVSVIGAARLRTAYTSEIQAHVNRMGTASASSPVPLLDPITDGPASVDVRQGGGRTIDAGTIVDPAP